MDDPDIRLTTSQTIELKLPNWVKPIQIGDRVFLFKWTLAGWKQLTHEEELDIKSRFGG